MSIMWALTEVYACTWPSELSIEAASESCGVQRSPMTAGPSRMLSSRHGSLGEVISQSHNRGIEEYCKVAWPCKEGPLAQSMSLWDYHECCINGQVLWQHLHAACLQMHLAFGRKSVQ